MSAAGPNREAEVWQALRGVLDPELDRSIVELDFVSAVEVDGGDVRVALRLPTFFCAPNFTWMMASDAREALRRLPWVDRTTVAVADHHADEQIADGVNPGQSFEEAFAGEATGGLEDLRRTFRRKAFMARQERLLAGLPPDRAARLTLAELPDGETTRAFLRLRGELGLDCSPGAPVLVGPDGEPVEELGMYLTRIRMVRLSLDGNAALCRGLLQARYALEGAGQEVPPVDR